MFRIINTVRIFLTATNLTYQGGHLGEDGQILKFR